MFKANAGLRDWAFELTKTRRWLILRRWRQPERCIQNTPMPANHPSYYRRSYRRHDLWHGKLMNDWANRWVSYWSDGETDFVTSAMEDTGTYQALYYLDKINKVDVDRFLVLRGGSNYTMQPPGVTAAENLLKENDGYAGMEASLENIYIAGSIVIDELLSNWDQYAETVPGSSR
ncbi:MAG: hypothetical protein CM15mP120_04520 [Pseudomonadota bacterium]|nr:MAG: hypothetical protein CM15mP120_04520 [Pseudomonadota bacterium]